MSARISIGRVLSIKTHKLSSLQFGTAIFRFSVTYISLILTKNRYVPVAASMNIRLPIANLGLKGLTNALNKYAEYIY